MQFGFGFRIFIILFVILSLLILGGVAAIVVTMIVRKRRNDRAPIRTVRAAVIQKRVDRSSHPNAGDPTGAHGYTSFSVRLVRFAVSDGTQTELTVDEETYDRLTEGDSGMLTVQGTRFVSFQKDA